MIPELVKAHRKLDKAVEAACGLSFTDDSQRVAFLFELYQKRSGELFVEKHGIQLLQYYKVLNPKKLELCHRNAKNNHAQPLTNP